MKKIFIAVFIFMTVILSAQDNVVPRFDLSGIFGFEKKAPYITTDLTTKAGLHIQHSPIAYFDIGLDLKIDDIIKFFHPDKNIRVPGELTFINTSLTFPKMNASNVDFLIFYGEHDGLNSDSILQKTAKVKMAEPGFFDSYPGNIFKPKNLVKGLGFGLYGNFNNPSLYLGGYSYWNGLLKEKLKFGVAFRGGWSTDSGALNFFLSTKFPKDVKKTNFDFGIAGIFKASYNYEFYVATTVSDLEMKKYGKDILNHIYVMTESRFTFEKFNSSIALFMASPNSIPKPLINTHWQDSLYGLNLKVAGGNLDIYRMESGVQALLAGDKYLTKANFVISPFYTCYVGDYILDVRVPLMPFLYESPEKVLSLQISFKTLR